MEKIFLDIETTGFSRETSKIIEISIRIRGKSFSTYIKRDNLKWMPGTLEFHQKTTPDILEKIKNGMDEQTLEKEIRKFYVSCGISKFETLKKEFVFVAHNGKYFDFPFIGKDSVLRRYIPLTENNYFDTLEYMKKSDFGKSLEGGNSLKELAGKLGIVIKEASLHTAAYDTELLEEVYKAIFKDKEEVV